MVHALMHEQIIREFLMLNKLPLEDKMDDIMVQINVAEAELCFHALVAASGLPTSPTLAKAMLALAGRIRYRKELAIDYDCEERTHGADIPRERTARCGVTALAPRQRGHPIPAAAITPAPLKSPEQTSRQLAW